MTRRRSVRSPIRNPVGRLQFADNIDPWPTDRPTDRRSRDNNKLCKVACHAVWLRPTLRPVTSGYGPNSCGVQVKRLRAISRLPPPAPFVPIPRIIQFLQIPRTSRSSERASERPKTVQLDLVRACVCMLDEEAKIVAIK